MADQSKKDPQPFNASLFGGSSGLTFDLDQASMLSPFSIGAAKKVEESPPKSAGSTPTPPGKSSPGLIPKSISKTKTPSPTPVSLFRAQLRLPLKSPIPNDLLLKPQLCPPNRN